MTIPARPDYPTAACWRLGNHEPRNIYEQGSEPHGRLAGQFLAPQVAARVTGALNGLPRPPGGIWTRQGRFLFEDGVDVGSMLSPEDATLVVEAMGGDPTDQAWPRWGSAADTVCEHASEAEARSYEANTATVHRWPSGPWLRDDGRVWEGDDQLSALQGQIFDLTNLANRYARALQVIADGIPPSDPRLECGVAREALRPPDVDWAELRLLTEPEGAALFEGACRHFGTTGAAFLAAYDAGRAWDVYAHDVAARLSTLVPFAR